MKRNAKKRALQLLEETENAILGLPHGLFSRFIFIRELALRDATGWDVKRCRRLVRENTSASLYRMVEEHKATLARHRRLDRTFIGQTHGD